MPVRVALCQLRSHPALEVGRTALLQEPFSPVAGTAGLARLAARGLDVHDLQIHCQQKYLEWQRARLAGVLDWLAPLKPDLLLLPEGAVPVDALRMMFDASNATGTCILAGSHTPLRSPAALKVYDCIGVNRRTVERIITKYHANNVLPLLQGGKADLIPKHSLSPFETGSLFAAKAAVPAPKPVPLSLGSSAVDLLPLICADALQMETVKGSYSLAAIVALDHKPDQFNAFIEQQVRNRRAVAFCNDARWGGSRFGVVVDLRTENWLQETFPSGLPASEGILVAELDLDVRAVEVATARPRQAFKLVKLAEIVYAGTRARENAVEMTRIRSLANSLERATALRVLTERGGLGHIQRPKVNTLAEIEERGAPSEAHWDVLGLDCDLGTLEDLTRLERELAATCLAELGKKIGTAEANRPDVLPDLAAYIADCRRYAQGEDPAPKAPLVSTLNVIDRDAEVRRVLEFLDHSAMVVLDAHGLPEIGKTSVLKKAFAESGVVSPVYVRLTETSSPEYLVAAILERSGVAANVEIRSPLTMARSSALKSTLHGMPVLVIERADNLLQASRWRDAESGEVLVALIDAAADLGTKIIFETRHELPLDLSDPSRRARLAVHGLDRRLSEYGVRLLDAQLRRVGFAGTDVPVELKQEIVARLGGHPKAIELAADVILDEGLADLVQALRERRGFLLNFVSRLVGAMSLTGEEQTLLRLLTLARTSLPRGVVPAIVEFPAAEPLRNLIALGAVEAVGPDTIEIAGILREHFDADVLPPDLVLRFHKEAAGAYDARCTIDRGDVASLVEAEYHSLVAGMPVRSASHLIDGALATVRTFMKLERYEEAAAVLTPLLARKETRELSRLAAEVEARCGRFESALRFAQRAFAQDRHDTALLGLLARIALTQFQDDAIAQLVRIARSAGVEDVSLMVVEGRLALRRREYAAAESILRRAVRRTEKNPWPYYFLGRTYMALGRVDDAISTLVEGERFCYEAEVRSRNAINAIKTQLGLVYLFEDRIDLAAPLIESVLREDKSPEAVRAYAALTIKREGIQQAGEAMRRLKEARIRSGADRAQFHLHYGWFFLGVGDIESALSEFRKAHAADPSDVFIMMKYAKGLFDLAVQRFAESDESFRDYLSQCAVVVRRILDLDLDNHEGVRLAEALRVRFGIAV